MFANTVFAIVRWYKEPTICGSNSLRHKITHLLGTYRVNTCVYNYMRYKQQELRDRFE